MRILKCRIFSITIYYLFLLFINRQLSYSEIEREYTACYHELPRKPQVYGACSHLIRRGARKIDYFEDMKTKLPSLSISLKKTCFVRL